MTIDNVNKLILRSLFINVHVNLTYITEKDLKHDQELMIVNAEYIAFSTNFFNIE